MVFGFRRWEATLVGRCYVVAADLGMVVIRPATIFPRQVVDGPT